MTQPSNNSGLSLEEILNDFVDRVVEAGETYKDNDTPDIKTLGVEITAAYKEAAAQIEQHYLGLLAEKKNLAIYRVPEDYREAKGFNQAIDQMAKNIRES